MDLTTNYMGLKLRNPIIASASPLSESVDNIKRMEDAGAGAVVMFSIFEEQLREESAVLEYATSAGSESFAEALSYFPGHGDYKVGPERYLEIINKASSQSKIPIIGSLNGVSDEGWIEYAKKIEQAGAKGLELNVYYIPTCADVAGAKVEQMYVDVLKAVKNTVKIPVALKLNPYFSSIANAAKQFEGAGADALVLFNRFYQPDFDLAEMEVVNNMTLSSPAEIRLPLRWIAILRGKTKCSLAATTGVHTSDEVVKYILAGADAVMTTSALLKNGIDHIKTLVDGLSGWMVEKEYDSVQQMKGAMSQHSVTDPTAFERANYIKTIEGFKNWFTPGVSGSSHLGKRNTMKVKVDESICTGCGVCADTCPEIFEMDANAISKVKVTPVPAALEAKAREAAEVCPVTCIVVE